MSLKEVEEEDEKGKGKWKGPIKIKEKNKFRDSCVTSDGGRITICARRSPELRVGQKLCSRLSFRIPDSSRACPSVILTP